MKAHRDMEIWFIQNKIINYKNNLTIFASTVANYSLFAIRFAVVSNCQRQQNEWIKSIITMKAEKTSTKEKKSREMINLPKRTLKTMTLSRRDKTWRYHTKFNWFSWFLSLVQAFCVTTHSSINIKKNQNTHGDNFFYSKSKEAHLK